MVFQRDPLSVLYDDDARGVLDRLYGSRLVGGTTRTIAYVDSPPLAERDDYDGSLTVQERAFSRAIHYQARRRRPRRSVKLNWGTDTIPGLGRPVTITMFTKSSAEKWADQQPDRKLWRSDPASGGRGYQTG